MSWRSKKQVAVAPKPVPTKDDFPPLGAKTVPPQTQKNTLDFKKSVLTTTTPAASPAPAPAPASASASAAVVTKKKHVSITRYGDDGPEDYDGPDEYELDEEEEEEEEEFNAHLASTRRRGDKGIW